MLEEFKIGQCCGKILRFIGAGCFFLCMSSGEIFFDLAIKLNHCFNFAEGFSGRHGFFKCDQHGDLLVLFFIHSGETHIHFHDQIRVYACECQIRRQQRFSFP